jgi:hypothetical protein
MRRAALICAAAALALTACGDAARPSPAGSTLDATLVDRDGDGALERGPGEPLVDRTELAPAAEPGRVIATVAQITDVQVRDEESPARVPFLDRLGGVFSSTFRPEEAFSTQVLAASVRAVNRLRPDATFVTGDIVDSSSSTELDQAIAVLDGGGVDPDTGGPGYDGVQAADNPAPLYYRPDLDAPRHAGALAAAQRRFHSPGLTAPWYPALGNHDLLVQGETPATPRIDDVATGGRMVVGLDPGLRPSEDVDAARAVDGLLAAGAKHAVVTRGAHGAVVRGGGITLDMPGEPAHPISTVGAGDVFMGTVIAGLAATRFYPPAIAAALKDAVVEGARATERWGALG